MKANGRIVELAEGDVKKKLWRVPPSRRVVCVWYVVLVPTLSVGTRKGAVVPFGSAEHNEWV
jgi:hypothetical protein